MQIVSLLFSKLNMYNVKILIGFISIIFKFGQCASSIPYQFGQIAQIQSKMLWLTPTGTDNNFSYIYKRPKASSPPTTLVAWSFSELNYAVNDVAPTWTGFNLYFRLYVYPYQAGARVQFNSTDRLISLRANLLILDPEFYVPTMIQIRAGSFQQGVSTSKSFTLLETTNYVILKYIYLCKMLTTSPINNRLKYTLDQTTVGDNYTLTVNFNGSYSTAIVAIRCAFVYKDKAKAYQIRVDHVDYNFTTPGVITIPKFNTVQSQFLIGLSQFRFTATNSASVSGIVWTMAFTPTSTSGMNIQVLSMSGMFWYFKYSVLTLSRYGCINSAYPFRSINTANSQIQCFDQCQTNQFVEYDILEMYQKCTNCATLCATCLDATKCSSCITGYVLDDTTMTCNLSPMYYMNGANPDLCSNAMTGCVECSDSSTCTVCDSTYYFSSGSCTQCQIHHPNCVKCSSTECLECQASMVLINGTLCLATQAPAFIPSSPNGAPAPCTDPFCSQCNYLNVSQCMICSSSLYTLIDGECKTVCGDSLIDGTDVCDDGNKIDFDGCSSDCLRVEDGFQCDTIPSRLAGYDKSHCYVTQSIKVDILSIRKPEMENRLKIVLRNSFTKILDWESIDQNGELSEMFTLTVPQLDSSEDGYVFAYEAQFIKEASEVQRLKNWMKLTSPEFYQQQRNLQQNTFDADLYEFIDLSATYKSKKESDPFAVISQSLTYQQSKLVFNPAATQRKAFKGPISLLGSSGSGSASLVQSSVTFPLKTDDNQLIQSYTAQYYNSASMISVLGTIASVLALVLVIVAILGFILDGKNGKQMLITLETVFIGQLAYFSMYGIGELNLLFLKLAPSMKFMTGFDLSLSPPENNHSFRELLGLGITSVHFSDNVNVSLVLVIACMLVGGILLLLNRLVFSKQSARRTFVKDSEQENKEEVAESKESETKEENKSYKVGMFLVFNLGFGLFLLFFYKCLFFVCIQVKYGMSSLASLDMVLMSILGVILLFYLVLLFAKIEYFDSLLESVGKPKSKINVFDRLSKNPEITASQIKRIEERFQKYLDMLPDNEKPESMRQSLNQKPSINVKFWYIFLIIIEHIANIIVIVLVSNIFIYYQAIPLFMYMLNLAFTCKFHPFQSASQYRLYITYVVSLFIQFQLLLRRIFIIKVLQSNGLENNFGLYCALSVILLIYLPLLVALPFNVYKIHKIRCCELNLDSIKEEKLKIIKVQLESIINEETLNHSVYQKDYSHIKNNTTVRKFSNGQIYEESIVQNYSEEKLKKLKSQFDKGYQDSPFFRIPVQVIQQTKATLDLVQSSAQNKAKFRGKGNDLKELDIQINQEITLNKLKKEIKQKLLANKIQLKMVRLHQQREETDRDLGLKVRKISSQSSAIGFINGKISQIDKKAASISIKQIKQQLKQQQLKQQREKTIQNSNDPDFGYIYTDTKVYNVYEEFDVI